MLTAIMAMPQSLGEEVDLNCSVMTWVQKGLLFIVRPSVAIEHWCLT